MSNRQMPTVTAGFDRNPLNVKRAAVCHLVVEVTAPKAEQTSPQNLRPLNLGLVIDASGSMQSGDAELGFSEEFGRTRLDAAKTAGTGVVEQLEDTDTLSVVSFADETITHVAALPLGNGGRQSAVAGIGSLDIVARYINMGAAPCYFGGMDTKFVLDGARREAEAFRELVLD